MDAHDRPTPGASSSEQLVAKIAQALYDQTAPARDFWTSRFGDVATGAYNPATDPAYAPARAGVERQYGVARDNLMGSTPAGGGLVKALAGLERGRADSMAGLNSSIIQGLLDKSYSTGFGAPGQAMTGAGNAAGLYNQRELATLQANAAADKGLERWKPGQPGGK